MLLTELRGFDIDPARPDISVGKAAADGTIDFGETASFTIVVANLGPGTATDVVLTDTLPGTGWVEDPDTLCTIAVAANDVLTCNIGSMPDSGEGSTFTVTLERPTTLADCGTLENTALVEASNEDPAELGNNEDSASISVICESTITIRKEVSGTDSQDFSFDDDIPGCNIGTLDDDPTSSTPKSVTCSNVASGEYTIHEDEPSGWFLDDIDCSSGATVDVDMNAESVTIDIEAGESVICTFFNVFPVAPVVTEVLAVQVTPTPTPTPTRVAEVLPTRLPETGDGPISGGFAWLLVFGLGAVGIGSTVILVTRWRRNER